MIVKILEWLKYPTKKVYHFMKKKVNIMRKGKQPIPRVPRPCILKLDYDSTPNDDEEDVAYVDKIINAVGLEFDPKIEILEFSEMIGAMGTVGEEKEPEPVELNSFEFFVQALSHFEGEARGQLSSGEQSPATPVESLSPRVEINAIKTAILQESHSNWSKLLDESPSTLNGPSGLLIGERSDDDSLTSMMVNAIDLDNNIIGTNSSLTSETSNG